MKSLLIIRHAKSSWSQPWEQDFERPLNKRGHEDAPAMARRLLAKGIGIDGFVSSSANRALTTATYFADVYGVPANDILVFPELYHASPATFYAVIRRLPDSIHTAAVFSHNPGITAFVNELTQVRIDDMPTCAIFAIDAAIDSWEIFSAEGNQFRFFDYPKSADR